MQFKARFFNGESPEPKHVVLGFENGRLIVSGGDGQVVSAHPVTEVMLLYADQLGNRVDLGVIGLKDYRLMVEAMGIKHELTPYLPQVAQPLPGDGWGAGLKISVFLFAFVAFLGVLAWQIEKILPVLVPDEYAESFGRAIADEYIEEHGGVCSAASGTRALGAMVKRLQPTTEIDRLTVRVADSDVVNAFAVPGQQIVIFRGLLEKAHSADEVAGVLAHEIGHVKHKHALRGLTRAIGISVLASVMSGSDASQMVQQLVVLGFSRSMEEEADEEALKTLSEAGVDHHALAVFFERMASENEGGEPAFMSFLSTHPASDARAAHIRSFSPAYDTVSVISEEEWKALQAIC